MSAHRSPSVTVASVAASVAWLALSVFLLAPDARAARGGPDRFGYVWSDSASGCTALASDDGTALVNSSFFPGNVLGPIDLGFDFPFYSGTTRQIWVNQRGIVHFQAPPAFDPFTNDSIPRVDGMGGFLAPWWGMGASPFLPLEWQDFPAAGYFKIRYTGFSFDGFIVEWEVYLYRNGDLRVEYPTPGFSIQFTIGLESPDESSGLLVYRDGIGSGGLTYGVPSPFAVCFARQRLLDCASATPITCGVPVNGSSPPALAANEQWYGCAAGTWSGRERVYRLDLTSLSDLTVTLTGLGPRNLAAFVLSGCDAMSCLGGGSASFVAPNASGTVYVVVDGLTTADDGNFTLTVTCARLPRTIACGQTLVGDTTGATNSFADYGCIAPDDWTGGERFYEVTFAPPGNLAVTVTGPGRPAAFIFDASLPVDPATCLAGGRSGTVLFAPPAGTYLIVVDGGAGSAAPFNISVRCVADLSCAGAPLLGCQQTIVGTTVGGPAVVSTYACAPGIPYDGPERVHVFTNPADQIVSFVLTTAVPGLDVFLLDSCNEGDCIEVGEDGLTRELPAGTYYLVVDGSFGVSGGYELTAICGAGLEPATVSFAGDAGDCFLEHKSAWMTPSIVQADVLLAIDLTGTMSQERAALGANMQDIIDRLSAFVDDLAFGLVSHVDYPGSYQTAAPCAYNDTYGDVTEWEYQLHQSMTTIGSVIRTAVTNLPPALIGGDLPESQARVLWEAANDPAIGWRPGSRRILVFFTDEVPHDCNVLECLGRVASARGADPGRDHVVGTADDITSTAAVQALVDAGIVLLPLESSDGFSSMGADTFPIWDCWARRTGGRAERLNFDGTVPAGLDLSQLIADLVEAQATVCPTLELRAAPGYESWLVSSTPVYPNVTLPATAEFDIQICIPPGTLPGAYDFEVQLFCGTIHVASQRVHVDVGQPACSTLVTSNPVPATICAGDTTTLDGSGLTLVNCASGAVYQWLDGTGLPIGNAATVDVTPSSTTTYTVSVTCTGDPTCTVSRPVTVTVQQRPSLATAAVRDLSECSLGLELSWPAATFRDPTGTGVYDVYRSTISCAEALTRPPVAVGVAGLSWFDDRTAEATPYYYVILAEDARLGTACVPAGPHHGGAVDATPPCVGPISDVSEPGFPTLLGWPLRLAHAGQTVTLSWPTARALDRLEHLHVLKAKGSPSRFTLGSAEGLVAGSWTETDSSSALQFFDVRAANPCEEQSLDDEPPGWDRVR